MEKNIYNILLIAVAVFLFIIAFTVFTNGQSKLNQMMINVDENIVFSKDINVSDSENDYFEYGYEVKKRIIDINKNNLKITVVRNSQSYQFDSFNVESDSLSFINKNDKYEVDYTFDSNGNITNIIYVLK